MHPDKKIFSLKISITQIPLGSNIFWDLVLFGPFIYLRIIFFLTKHFELISMVQNIFKLDTLDLSHIKGLKIFRYPYVHFVV